jgi:hypothetical protein
MQMTASSIDKPRPEDCTYVKRFAVSNEQGVYVASVKRYHVHVGRSNLWLSGDLSIPLSAIRAKEIIKRGWLIKRHALRIVFENPALGLDAVHLCDIDFLGFYHRQSLLDLSVAIDDAIRNAGLEEAARSAELDRIPHRGGYFRTLAESFKGCHFS